MNTDNLDNHQNDARTRGGLDEHESKALLSSYGIPVVAGRLVYSEGEAVQMAFRLGGEVVLKVVGPSIQHKSDKNLIRLALEGDEEVRAAYRQLCEASKQHSPRILVERMVRGSREFLLGMKRDPVFGPVLLFGVGGIFAEAHRDVAMAVAPVEDVDIDRMFDGIRAHSLLGQIRGLPPVDREALARMVRALSRISMERPEIAEIDVNPVVIDKQQPVAVDALIILDARRDLVVPKTRTVKDFQKIIRPRSIAVVGASADRQKWGGSLLTNVLDGGWEGLLFAVNPRGGKVRGLPVYRRLADLPEVPDLVLIAVSSEHVEKVLDECIAIGVRSVIVITAGFSEMGDTGASAERELAAKADAAGVTMVGPNCMGVLSAHERLHAVGFLASRPQPGRLSIVSQSGNIGVRLVMEAERRGVGIDKYISTGNGASTSVLDAVDALAEDPQTGALLVYLEGIDDGARFRHVMSWAARVKPVVVVKGGMSLAGGRAAASHTGALATSADAYSAAARQTGCVPCNDPEEGLDAALCLANLPLPKGPRVGVVTLGGGWGVLIADELIRCGLAVPELAESDLRQLDAVLPKYWSRGNPVDLVATLDPDVATSVVDIVSHSEDFDAVIVLGVLGSVVTGRALRNTSSSTLSQADQAFIDHVLTVMEETGKPIINVPMNRMDASLIDGRRGMSAVALGSPHTAARAMSKLFQYSAFRSGVPAYAARKREYATAGSGHHPLGGDPAVRLTY